MPEKNSVIVIGAGAAGITAAVGAARRGSGVVLCEKMPQPGKKILVCGAGRCNLLNEDLHERHYRPEARELVKAVFARFGKDDIKRFFRELGLLTYAESDSRVFPVTNQAASVYKVLELELNRLGVPLMLNCEIARVKTERSGFALEAKSGKTLFCEKVIIACGGKSYPALGADGSGYALAAQCGHRITAPVPGAVPLEVKDKMCHLLQGQKIPARVHAVIGGREAKESRGELLFAKYGLSGTAILDVSDEISIAWHRQGEKNISLIADLLPFMEEDALRAELSRRLRRGMAPEQVLAGVLPNKFYFLTEEFKRTRDVEELARLLKQKKFAVSGTRGWNEAEFTCGGVDPRELTPALESRRKKNLYFCGEVIDAGGRRGGYHLAWAWASGFIAGLAGRE